MALHILTLARDVITEIVDFDNTNGEVVKGEWVALDPATGKYNNYKKMGPTELGDASASLAILDSLRSDTGYPHTTNPDHVITGVVSTLTVISKWDDLKIITDQIDVTGVSFGDQLTVVGGKFVKLTDATQNLFGIYQGVDPENMVDGGHVIKLKNQPRFSV